MLVMVRLALRSPRPVGLNAIKMPHVLKGWIVAQGWLCSTAKSDPFVPLMANLLMVSGLVPPLKRRMAVVTSEFTLAAPKSNAEASDRLALAACPTPDRVTVCGLPAALSLMGQ